MNIVSNNTFSNILIIVIKETVEFLDTEVGDDLPLRLRQELKEQQERINNM